MTTLHCTVYALTTLYRKAFREEMVGIRVIAPANNFIPETTIHCFLYMVYWSRIREMRYLITLLLLAAGAPLLTIAHLFWNNLFRRDNFTYFCQILLLLSTAGTISMCFDSSEQERFDASESIVLIPLPTRSMLFMISAYDSRRSQGRCLGGSVGFCERDALQDHVIAEKKKRIPLFDVDSPTLPFLVEGG